MTDTNNLTIVGRAVGQMTLFTATASGAVPPSGGGTANFLRADGTWAVPTGLGGPINVNSLTKTPLVGDGVTPNFDAWDSIISQLYALSPEMPVAVTLTSGSPCVVNWTAHGLRPNQAFYFTVSGGSLPSGIDANKPYFVTMANLTANSFTFTTFNNYTPSQLAQYTFNEGPPVNTTGSGTGSVSIVLTGRQWIDLYIPPGSYSTNGSESIRNQAFMVPNGVSRVRIFAYGCTFDDLTSPGVLAWPYNVPTASGWLAYWFDYVSTTPNMLVAPQNPAGTVTLLTPANASNYYVGEWIAIIGLDLQDQLGKVTSGPPNNQFFEFNQITAISGGVLSLQYPLKQVYLSTWPNMANGTPGLSPMGGGPAMIIPMGPCWDCEVQVYGGNWTLPYAFCGSRKQRFQDCTYTSQGGGNAPGLCREYIVKNCFYGNTPTSGVEVDKMLDYLELDGVEAFWAVNSTSANLIRLKNAKGSFACPKRTYIENSLLDRLHVGVGLFGSTDLTNIQNTNITYFDMSPRDDDPGNGPALYGSNILATWSFSNGTFSKDLSTIPQANTPQTWAVPGGKYYLCDEAGYYQNMGSPFAILAVYMSGTVFNFDTTLKAIPTIQTQSTVTISIASPAVVTWTAHGLAAGTPVLFLKTNANTLPTGLTAFQVYFVSATGLTANTFEVAASPGGTPIATSGTQSGTQTAVANPLHIRPHPCPRFTAAGNSGTISLVDLNGAIDEPIFSRMKRAFVGGHVTAETNYLLPYGRIWGKLVSLTVNVIQPATSGTMQIYADGFTQPNLGYSAFNQTIDLTTAGVRTVTQTATTPLGTDVLTAYTEWISGNPGQFAPTPQGMFRFSGTPAGYQNNAIIEVELLTDQGLTKYPVVIGSNSQVANDADQIYIDASLQSYEPD